MNTLTYSKNNETRITRILPTTELESLMIKAYSRPYLPKSDLVDGTWYFGHCRNSTQARWNAEKQRFEYVRTKFFYKFVEEISHPEDEKYYDVFYAQKAISKEEVIENIPDKN